MDKDKQIASYPLVRSVPLTKPQCLAASPTI